MVPDLGEHAACRVEYLGQLLLLSAYRTGLTLPLPGAGG
jgi:hypothetical protein